MPKEFARAVLEVFYEQKQTIINICRENMVDEEFVGNRFSKLDDKLQNINLYLSRIERAEEENKQLNEQHVPSLPNTSCKEIVFKEAGIRIIDPKPKAPEPVVVVEEEATKNPPEAAKEELLFAQITDEEFAKVPDYMKGRLTAAVMNELLGKLESLLVKKRTLMRRKLSSLSLHEKNIVIKWREEAKNLGRKAVDCPWFCSEVDLRAELTDKLKLAVIKGLQILRHLKRITESKLAGKNYVFAVCK
ncbi:unnamed protein product [Auanema sp. JU1783]|nr:unnamed protein product [Auanema sp. JU1783]